MSDLLERQIQIRARINKLMKEMRLLDQEERRLERRMRGICPMLMGCVWFYGGNGVGCRAGARKKGKKGKNNKK